MKDLLDSLNENQKLAVQHIDGALLILAGAGSGKTKTVTARLAYLLGEVGIPAQNTLTLTFTNKAAKEMQQRAINLIASANLAVASMPLLCTFHKFGLLFLQKYIHLLGRSQTFNVIDEEDKKKILRDIKKNYFSRTRILPKLFALLDFISETKNNNLMPQEIIAKDIEEDGDLKIAIYTKYQEFLLAYNLIDFDDLLLLPHRILAQDSLLRERLSQKYQYIMVDEYQDTNDLQANFLKQLCTAHENICVVGDDDQSIYSWRGANIINILEFHKQFHNTKIIKLEQNYRSTKQILDTANHLIAHNTDRHGKILTTTKKGDKVKIFTSIDDKEEMQQIILHINRFRELGAEYSDIAILFRLNPLSRNIEKFLARAQIPYQIIGGIRFYERQEIKDVLAYLRLGLNPHDNFSFTRIINKPKRGIGEKSMQEILHLSSHHKSVYEAFMQGLYNTTKYFKKLQDFFDMIESLRDCIGDNPLFISDIFTTKIKLYHEDDAPDNDGISNEERRENIKEFFEHLRDYFSNTEILTSSKKQERFQDFLNTIMLTSSSDMKYGDGILCMSIHNSKGLEFKHVFVIGMEKGLFPLQNTWESDSLSESDDIKRTNFAEERRLAYVAFTRAKESLVLSYVKNRFYRNKLQSREPSQFLIESGVANFKDFEKFGYKMETMDTQSISEAQQERIAAATTLHKGDCVQHKILGFGRIEHIEGSGMGARARVNFGGLRRDILLTFLTKA